MMTKAIVKLNPKTTAQAIVDALASGLVKAAGTYKDYVTAGGDPMALREHAPISADVWKVLDDVAVGRIDPRAFALAPTIARALMRLPVAEQSKLLDSGVELASSDRSKIRRKLSELSISEARMAFGPQGVRTVPQQVAALKVATPKTFEEKPKAQFEVANGKLIVYCESSFSRLDLIRILGQMG